MLLSLRPSTHSFTLTLLGLRPQRPLRSARREPCYLPFSTNSRSPPKLRRISLGVGNMVSRIDCVPPLKISSHNPSPSKSSLVSAPTVAQVSVRTYSMIIRDEDRHLTSIRASPPHSTHPPTYAHTSTNEKEFDNNAADAITM